MCRRLLTLLIFFKTTAVCEYSLKYLPGLIKVNINYYTTVKSCEYFETEPGDLPLADSIGFTFPENSIFFTETTCRGGLNFRQACAVESAAKAHPERQINVLFAAAVTKKKLAIRPLSALQTYPNIKLYRIRLNRYGYRTPVEDLIKHRLVLSSFFINHAADIIKMLTLYKFGGIFLDLDVIILKPFDDLPHSRWNFIGREDDETFSLGVVAYSKDAFGRRLADISLQIMQKDFNPQGWRANSIECFRKTMLEVYKNNDLEIYSDDDGNIIVEDNITDFAIYKTNYFYPIPFQKYKRYFQPGYTLQEDNVYMVHMWNQLSKYTYIAKGSIYANLAKRFCPKTMNLYNFENVRNRKAKKVKKKSFMEKKQNDDLADQRAKNRIHLGGKKKKNDHTTSPKPNKRMNWQEYQKEAEEQMSLIRSFPKPPPVKGRKRYKKKENVTSPKPPIHKLYKLVRAKSGFLGPLGDCCNVKKVIPSYLNENENNQ